ncbi:MAG: hypothetical protein JSV44_10865 [Candidatus Zixiibacteriota bacterium]|nr:MAG: hypothetical protein JSV44_10865 [candidate division Zixibacteria bacterium]
MVNMKLVVIGLALFFTLVLLFVAGASYVKADEIMVDLRDLGEGDLAVDGFELKSRTRLTIYAVGAESENSDDMYAYGWIIVTDTREPVWVLSSEDTRRYEGSRKIREYEDEVTFSPGRYEVYYYVGQPYSHFGKSIDLEDLGDLFDAIGVIFDDGDAKLYQHYPEDIEDLMLTIRAPEGSFSKFNPVSEHMLNAVVDFTKADDDFYKKKGFTLEKELTLQVRAIGEYSTQDRVFVDYGWIIDADSRKKVWNMDKWNTAWAGGGRKNRGFIGEITLPAGNYIAAYATDGSHAFGEWNVPPPYDPLYYGLNIAVSNKDDLGYVEDYEDTFSEAVIISLKKVRDNVFKQKGFTLDKSTELHIFAIGEFGYNDEFVDYGWIENLKDNDIVWEMTEDNTEHAGGGKKNRKFDGVVTLPAGSYVVYYASDGSHSYRRWNTSPPIDQEMWGVTIFGVGRDFDPKSVPTFDDLPVNTKILADITGIGDDEEIRERFTLDEPQKVKISALGEGKGGRMYDYGWIEDARTGEIIWEMTYRKTKHAGGAKKNRKADASIYLEAGEYVAYYVTDGSHSFPDFNASRPAAPQKWGMMITKVD